MKVLDWLSAITPAHWSIVVAIAFLVSLWIWFNRESADNTFRFVDAFLDEGKASSNKCLLWMFSIVAVWQIMLGTFRGQDMSSLTWTVIGILAGGKALQQVGSAFASRPPTPPSPVNAPGADVTVNTPPAPAPTIGTSLPPSIRVRN